MNKCECSTDGRRKRNIVTEEGQPRTIIRLEEACNEGTVVRNKARYKPTFKIRINIKLSRPYFVLLL